MITTSLDLDLVRGAAELEPTARGGLRVHRLPGTARRRNRDPQLAAAETQPAGVRLAFRTEADVVELDVVATKRVYPGGPPRPDGVHDLVVDGVLAAQSTVAAGDTLVIDMATGSVERRPGEPATLRFALPPGRHDVELWLPHDEETELVALRSDAALAALPRTRRTWLHHGSSISQGSQATHPTGTWPAVAARLAGVDLHNLGLGGSALLDPYVAQAMRDTAADLVSLKLGINLVNHDLLRRRALGPAVHGFLDTIREGHPATPLLLVTPVHCAIHEEVPGPSDFELEALARGTLRFRAAGDPADVARGRLTLAVVREELAAVVADRDDSMLFLLDGPSLYGPEDAVRLPLPDELHPDTASHRLIGERFADAAFGAGGPFG